MTDLLDRTDPQARGSRAGQEARRTEILARLGEIEEHFGNPWDRHNPVGFAALLAADDAAELPAEALRRYHRLGINAEFVPEPLGGRLTGLDALGVLLRPLFRRDVTLAVGGALTSFMASMVVWLNGDEAQQRRAADTLLDGGVMTIAFQQFAHGNDFVNDEFRAARTPEGLVLSGRKASVNNAEHADLLVAFARTGPGSDDSSHTILLTAPADLPPGRVRYTGRYRTDAVRGLRIAGLEFDDCPVPEDAVVGGWSRGIPLGLRAFPITHATVPSMVLGLADTALRTATRFALEKGAFSRPVTEVPMARNALAGTFADLLICDSLALAATRALHLVPEHSNVLSAVAKYLVPKLVGEALYHLSVVMGDAFHTRSGDHAIFQKHVRDLAMVTFGHVSSAVCQATIAPCLPGIAAAPWTADRAAPDALFRPYGPVPPIDSERLAGFGGEDGLCAYAVRAAAGGLDVEDTELGAVLRDQAAVLLDELAEIRAAALELDGGDGQFTASVRSFPLTDRYALALAAVSCLGVWLNADPEHEPYSARPEWLALALDRLLRRLGRTTAPLPASVEAALCGEVLQRADQDRSYDLYDVRLAG